jgi:hypothetical protein
MVSRRDRLIQIGVLLAALCGVCAAWGWHSALHPQGSPLDLLWNLATALLSALTALHLGKLRGRTIPVLSRWLLVIVWPLAVPLYLLWAYGWRGAIAVFLGAFGMTAAFVGGAIVAMVAAALIRQTPLGS